jgi:hypothetical protein
MSSCTIALVLSVVGVVVTTILYWKFTNRIVRYLKDSGDLGRSFVPFHFYWYAVPKELAKDRTYSLVFLLLSTFSVFSVLVAIANYC